jgi:hypothetical protein
MFIGSEYKLTNNPLRDDDSMLGFKTIIIKDRVLSRTELREKFKDRLTQITSYYYTLHCLVDGGDYAEIAEEDLENEVMQGYYDFCGGK